LRSRTKPTTAAITSIPAVLAVGSAFAVFSAACESISYFLSPEKDIVCEGNIIGEHLQLTSSTKRTLNLQTGT
jgi:hypothetical protein